MWSRSTQSTAPTIPLGLHRWKQASGVTQQMFPTLQCTHSDAYRGHQVPATVPPPGAPQAALTPPGHGAALGCTIAATSPPRQADFASPFARAALSGSPSGFATGMCFPETGCRLVHCAPDSKPETNAAPRASGSRAIRWWLRDPDSRFLPGRGGIVTGNGTPGIKQVLHPIVDGAE